MKPRRRSQEGVEVDTECKEMTRRRTKPELNESPRAELPTHGPLDLRCIDVASSLRHPLPQLLHERLHLLLQLLFCWTECRPVAWTPPPRAAAAATLATATTALATLVAATTVTAALPAPAATTTLACQQRMGQSVCTSIKSRR